MPVHDDLGMRMKTYYEGISKTKLMRRTPVVIRLDGKAFHTFTRNFKRPFDAILMESMQETMLYLCEHIQGCVLGYTQSDEITLVLVDYKRLDSDAWFDYEVQKICSISASMATLAFQRAFSKNVLAYEQSIASLEDETIVQQENKYVQVLKKAMEKGAMFDSRCFNIPKEEVTNMIYWRQVDATRNSIQMVGQAYFPHKELQNKSCNMIQDMLFEQKGINWNDYTTSQKRGSCCIKKAVLVSCLDKTSKEKIEVEREKWVIDTEIPLFKGEGREYIERLINVE